MILTEEAQAVFGELGLDPDDALLAAKSMDQAVIEDSQTSGTPLTSMVCEVVGTVRPRRACVPVLGAR